MRSDNIRMGYSQTSYADLEGAHAARAPSKIPKASIIFQIG